MNKFAEAKATFQASRSKLKLHNSTFLDEAEAEHDKAKHPADLRRLHNKVKEHLRTVIDAGVENDVTDGWFAYLDMIEAIIQARVDGDRGNDGARLAGSSWVNAETGEPVHILASTEKVADVIGHPRSDDTPALSVGGYIQAVVNGAKTPAIKAALTEGTDSAGGYSIPLVVLPQFIDKLRNATQFIAAGGKTLMLEGMKTRILRVTSDPTAGWRGELDPIVESNMTFDALDFIPQMVHVLVKVSVELLQDTVNADTALENALVKALTLELDRACFFGTGHGDKMPLGIAGTNGINTVSMGTNGGQITSFDPFIDGLYATESANSPITTAAVMNPRTMQAIRKLKDGQGQPLRSPDDVAKLPKLTTNSFPIDETQGTAAGVCSSIIQGDFGQALLGIRQEWVIKRLDQAFINNMEVGFLAWMRADLGVTHPAAFTRIAGIKAG